MKKIIFQNINNISPFTIKYICWISKNNLTIENYRNWNNLIFEDYNSILNNFKNIIIDRFSKWILNKKWILKITKKQWKFLFFKNTIINFNENKDNIEILSAFKKYEKNILINKTAIFLYNEIKNSKTENHYVIHEKVAKLFNQALKNKKSIHWDWKEKEFFVQKFFKQDVKYVDFNWYWYLYFIDFYWVYNIINFYSLKPKSKILFWEDFFVEEDVIKKYLKRKNFIENDNNSNLEKIKEKISWILLWELSKKNNSNIIKVNKTDRLIYNSKSFKYIFIDKSHLSNNYKFLFLGINKKFSFTDHSIYRFKQRSPIDWVINYDNLEIEKILLRIFKNILLEIEKWNIYQKISNYNNNKLPYYLKNEKVFEVNFNNQIFIYTKNSLWNYIIITYYYKNQDNIKISKLISEIKNY